MAYFIAIVAVFSVSILTLVVGKWLILLWLPWWALVLLLLLGGAVIERPER
jgi:hypothetical protein